MSPGYGFLSHVPVYRILVLFASMVKKPMGWLLVQPL